MTFQIFRVVKLRLGKKIKILHVVLRAGFHSIPTELAIYRYWYESC